MPARSRWRTAALVFVFVWFFLGGIGHFVLTKMFTSVVPPGVPFPREMVWFTGVCEIAGAIALWIPKLRRVAGLALIVLTICVTPVHVVMLMNAAQYAALGLPVLWGRMLFQPVFIGIVWFATQTGPKAPDVAAKTLGEGVRGAS